MSIGVVQYEFKHTSKNHEIPADTKSFFDLTSGNGKPHGKIP